MSEKTIESRIKSITCEQLGINQDTEISHNSLLTSDLGADSLDVVELIMAFEGEFNLEIPDADAQEIKTFGDIVAYISKRVES